MRTLQLALATASLLALALAGAAPAAAGPLCANNAQNAPSGCVVELKGYGGWGVCAHGVGHDACPYLMVSGAACAYLDGSQACAGSLPHGACVNHAPSAPADCVVELKGYGGWGVCAHVNGNDACPYFQQNEWFCLYANADVACVPTL